MSERYGLCKLCLGQGRLNENECGRCNGTGFSGDANDLVDTRYALRLDRDKSREAYEKAVEVFLSIFNSHHTKSFNPKAE